MARVAVVDSERCTGCQSCMFAWTTEALEGGIISLDDSLGVKLTQGDYPNYIEAVQE
jgi:Fe-S-cluster-containing dehydrogenase component